MDLPAWVKREIDKFDAPATGKVVIVLERYMTGVTHIEIGAQVKVKAPPVAGNVVRKPMGGEATISGASGKVGN